MLTSDQASVAQSQAFKKTLHSALAAIVVSGLYNWWILRPKWKAMTGIIFNLEVYFFSCCTVVAHFISGPTAKLYKGLSHLKIALGIAAFGIR